MVYVPQKTVNTHVLSSVRAQVCLFNLNVFYTLSDVCSVTEEHPLPHHNSQLRRKDKKKKKKKGSVGKKHKKKKSQGVKKINGLFQERGLFLN